MTHHNLTTLWGWIVQLIPIGDIAYRANLSCAIAGGLAICIFYITIYIVHNCWITALVSSLFLMVSHSMWWHSTFIFEFAVNAVLITLSLYLYAQLQRTKCQKYIYALFLLSGLALFQLYLLGSLLVGTSIALLYRLILSKDRPWPVIFKSTLSFFIGLIPWILTFIHDVSISNSVSHTFSSALFGGMKGLFFSQPLWNALYAFLFLFFIQFPSLYLLPICLGLYFFLKEWKLSESSLGIISTIIPAFVFVLGFSVAMFHLNADYLIVFIIFAFWASFAVHKIVHHHAVIKSRPLQYSLIILVLISLAWTIYFYSHLSVWGQNPASFWSKEFSNRTYNSYRVNEFIANPNKRNYNDISDFCKLALEKLPPHAEFWNTDELAFQFQYYQSYYYKRLDLEMLNISSVWNDDTAPYARRIRQAYLNGKDLFFCSMLDPEREFLSRLPNHQDYKFKKFYLNNKCWIYKLITVKDKAPREKVLWKRWDILPKNRPILINLTNDNVLNFQEGDVYYQTDFPPEWSNQDQIYFHPHKPGGEIGFLLRFSKSFRGNLEVNLTTAPDTSIIQILLNNKPLGGPVDLYTEILSIKKLKLENISFDQGNNILSVKVIGQNNKSTGMGFGIDTIKIIPN